MYFIAPYNEAPFVVLFNDFLSLLRILIFKNILLVDFQSYNFYEESDKNSSRMIFKDKIGIYDSYFRLPHHRFGRAWNIVSYYIMESTADIIMKNKREKYFLEKNKTRAPVAESQV